MCSLCISQKVQKTPSQNANIWIVFHAKTVMDIENEIKLKFTEMDESHFQHIGLEAGRSNCCLFAPSLEGPFLSDTCKLF